MTDERLKNNLFCIPGDDQIVIYCGCERKYSIRRVTVLMVELEGRW